MSLTPTTLDALEDLFVAQILGTTPRMQVQGAEGWKHYGRHVAEPSVTRRFTLRWEPGSYVRRGIFTNGAVECDALLRVRTDYAAKHTENMKLVQDDWHQLRDRLQLLTATAANGLVLVLTTARIEPVNIATASTASSDVVQIDLPYQVRYLQLRG